MKKSIEGHKKYCWSVYFLLLLGAIWQTNRFMPSWMFSIDHWLKGAVNLIPFKTIAYYFSSLWTGSLNVSIPIRFFTMNLIVGIVLGVLFVIMNRKASIIQMIAFSCLFFTVFEGTALLLKIGIFDVDAILLRTVGAVGIYKLIHRYVLTGKKVIEV